MKTMRIRIVLPVVFSGNLTATAILVADTNSFQTLERRLSGQEDNKHIQSG